MYLNEFFFGLEVVDDGLGVLVKCLEPLPHGDFVVVGSAARLRAPHHPLHHLLVIEDVGDAAGASADVRLECQSLSFLPRVAVQQKARRAHHRVSA